MKRAFTRREILIGGGGLPPCPFARAAQGALKVGCQTNAYPLKAGMREAIRRIIGV
jgi:hypothetical protein